jgi:AcrR family transcriptional regulator
MFDQTTLKGRILAAALTCAAAKSWREVALIDIAEAAAVPLAELRAHFASKTDIVAGILRAVDDEVLKRAPKRSEGQERRDRLFDVIMTRFDVLAPHKAALKSIYKSGSADFDLAGPYLASQRWMLEAAGIGTEGATGALRLAGLGIAYAAVFRTWLEDDDPGQARTMAALDRRLRRGERALSGIEQVGAVLDRFAAEAPAFWRNVVYGRPKPDAPAPGREAGTV